MELEELRKTWQSVKTYVDSQISENKATRIAIKKNDIKSRLLKRSLWDGIISMIGTILLATSPIWSPMKFPDWWLATVCLTMIFANLCGIRIYRSIKAVNLWDSTNNEILIKIVSIKKLYRNIELATAAVVIPLMIWMSLTPFFIHSWRMFFTWVLTILGFTLEYLWYSSNIKQLNTLVNWEKEL